MTDDETAATTSPILLADFSQPVSRRAGPDWLVVGAVAAAVVVVLALGAVLWLRNPVATANSTEPPSGSVAAPVPAPVAPSLPSPVETASPSAPTPAPVLTGRPTRKALAPLVVRPVPKAAPAPPAASTKPSNSNSNSNSNSGNNGNNGNGNGGGNGGGGNGGGGNGDLFPDGF